MKALVLSVLLAASLIGCTDPAVEPAGPNDPPPYGTGQAQIPDLSYYGVNDDPMLGDIDAKVQVVAFEAPGCSACRHYHQNLFPEIKADFIDTDKIAYHMLQWRVGYPYDIQGGIGLECVHREMGSEAYASALDRAFGNQTYGQFNEAQHDGVRAWLRDTADQHDGDGEAVIACYDGAETEGEVYADIEAGRDSGAGHNPGFAVIADGQVTLLKGASRLYQTLEAHS